MISVELVEAITDKLRSRGLTANRDDVASALDDAHLTGWRFVRTEPAGVWVVPDEPKVFYEDERRPDDAVELFEVREEWTP